MNRQDVGYNDFVKRIFMFLGQDRAKMKTKYFFS